MGVPFIYVCFSAGVGHGDELLYLFRSPIAFGQHSASDNLMSEVLTTYWANFARTGYGIHPSPAQGTVFILRSHRVRYSPQRQVICLRG